MTEISTFLSILKQFNSNEEAMEFWIAYRKSDAYDEDFEKYITKNYNHDYVECDINGYIIMFYIGNIKNNGEIK